LWYEQGVLFSNLGYLGFVFRFLLAASLLTGLGEKIRLLIRLVLIRWVPQHHHFETLLAKFRFAYIAWLESDAKNNEGMGTGGHKQART
jgi:hypothetical protein